MSYEYRSVLMRGAVLAAAAVISSSALADADLDAKMADPANWASQAGDNANHRHSTLKQITGTTSASCRWPGRSPPACCAAMRAPLVIGDTMYVHTPFPNKVYALDLKDQTDHLEVRAEAGSRRRFR